MDASDHARPRARHRGDWRRDRSLAGGGLFGTYRSYAEGFARMVDVAGIDHVGLGTDQLGLVGPSTMPSYADLPQLAAALRTRFSVEETAKLLGGNYRRVFAASLA
jgi:membrane dipeptidase